MFDLEEQVQAWRRSLARSLPGRDEEIDELESHLRETFEHLVVASNSPQEAWATALAQLGSTEELVAEFRKLPVVAFYRWLPAQVVLVVHVAFALWIGRLIFSTLAGPKHDALLAFHVFSMAMGYSAVLAIGGLAAWSIIARATFGWTGRKSAALCSAVRWWTAIGLVLTALGVVLGSFWARDHMDRFWSWDIKETAALGLLLWNGLVLALLARWSRSEQLVMLLCQFGNVVVAFCSLAPAVLRAVQHGSVSTTALRPLAVFVLIELALAALTFIKPGRISLSRG